MLAKIQLIGNTAILYLVGICGLALLASNFQIFRSTAQAEAPTVSTTQHKPTNRFVLVSGKPIRIVLPDSSVDLLVDEGYYDESTASWTLSPTHAQFAMMTMPANDAAGNTLIYGHGTDAVFGVLNTTPPQPGAQALIYTDNGHVFSYRFKAAENLQPNDTGILYDTTGPPTLTIQTCSGALSEWRTMFQYGFEKVVQ